MIADFPSRVPPPGKISRRFFSREPGCLSCGPFLKAALLILNFAWLSWTEVGTGLLKETFLGEKELCPSNIQ